MMKKIILQNSIAALLGAVAFFAAHAHAGDFSGSSYDSFEARRVQTAVIATVEDVREVRLATQTDTSKYAAGALGGVAGAAIGQQLGGGNGRLILTALLTAAGAQGGAEADRAMRTARALEITVSLDNGQTYVITQEIDVDAASLQPGDRVRIITGANTRVVRMHNQAVAKRQ